MSYTVRIVYVSEWIELVRRKTILIAHTFGKTIDVRSKLDNLLKLKINIAKIS